MKTNNRTKYIIIVCCFAIVLWDLASTVYALVAGHDHAKEYVMNVPAGSDPTDYYLSHAKSAEDSLYIIIRTRKLKEQGMNQPTLSNLFNVAQNTEDISFQSRCEVFLSYAKTSKDTAYVYDVMQKPFKYSTPKYYHEESQTRISSLKHYFNQE